MRAFHHFGAIFTTASWRPFVARAIPPPAEFSSAHISTALFPPETDFLIYLSVHL
jgi:hypothetical protein